MNDFFLFEEKVMFRSRYVEIFAFVKLADFKICGVIISIATL